MSAEASSEEMKRILGLEVPISVALVERGMSVASLLGVRVGTIMEFEVPFDADLTLHAGNRLIGIGRPVKVGEHFGLRLTEVGSVEQRIGALGRSG